MEVEEALGVLPLVGRLEWLVPKSNLPLLISLMFLTFFYTVTMEKKVGTVKSPTLERNSRNNGQDKNPELVKFF